MLRLILAVALFAIVAFAGRPTYPTYGPSAPSYANQYPSTPSYNAPSYDNSDDYSDDYSTPSPAYSKPAYNAPSYNAPSGDDYSDDYSDDYNTPSPSYSGDDYSDDYNMPSYSKPAYNKPAYNKPSYNAPSYDNSDDYSDDYSTPSPAYSKPAYNKPAYKAPAPAYSKPAYNKPSYNKPAYSKPAYSKPAYNKPAYNKPAYNKHPTADYDDEDLAATERYVQLEQIIFQFYAVFDHIFNDANNTEALIEFAAFFAPGATDNLDGNIANGVPAIVQQISDLNVAAGDGFLQRTYVDNLILATYAQYNTNDVMTGFLFRQLLGGVENFFAIRFAFNDAGLITNVQRTRDVIPTSP